MQRHYLWLPVAFAFGSISCSTDTRTPEIQLDQVATHGITIGIPDFMQVPAADSLSPDSTRAWIGNSPSTDDWPFQIDIRPPSRRDWYWGTDRALNCADCLTHRDLIAWSEMRGSRTSTDEELLEYRISRGLEARTPTGTQKWRRKYLAYASVHRFADSTDSRA